MRPFILSAACAAALLAAVSAQAQGPASAPPQGQGTPAGQGPAPALTPPQGQGAPAPVQAPQGAPAIGAAQAPGPFQSAAAPGANPLPPGPGREIVAVACTQCHGPSAFAQLRQGEQAWRYQVYDMILRGAEIAPSDIDAAVKYLTASFGPGVNVPASAPVTLPDGAGKEIVEGGCTLCHGLDRIANAKRSPNGWQAIVNRMIFFGAPLSADQAKTVVAYLDNQFGAQ